MKLETRFKKLYWAYFIGRTYHKTYDLKHVTWANYGYLAKFAF